MIASVFDPMGLVSPFVLLGKQILQEVCLLGLYWDAPLPDPLITRYKNWCEQLSYLSKIKICRFIKPHDFEVSSIEFYHFSDASSSGYGVCSNVRLIDVNVLVFVSLLLQKLVFLQLSQLLYPALN